MGKFRFFVAWFVLVNGYGGVVNALIPFNPNYWAYPSEAWMTYLNDNVPEWAFAIAVILIVHKGVSKCRSLLA